MANQTELLNVSDEMKLDDMRQELCGSESDEKLCSSSLDTTEELHSSLEPDTCGNMRSLSEVECKRRLRLETQSFGRAKCEAELPRKLSRA